MKTVLFVDDERAIRSAIKRIFLDRDDLHCLFAASGQEGLDILQREKVWVLVSDYMMPGMRGIELLSKAKSVRPDTIRIMMTAFTDIKIAVDAINKSEAYRFITKPWNNNELIDIVDDAMAQYQLIQSLKNEDEKVFLSLARAIELKDPYTRLHCDRVAGYAVRLAQAAGLSDDIIKDIRYGSWLHDCGKIGVPEEVLNFAGRLTENDIEMIMQHPRWGSEVARQASMSNTVINIILYHHERYDGMGYPAGLKGDDIPIEARIVAIADVFDALNSDRPYCKAHDLEKILEIMQKMTETHFEPRLLRLFLPIAEEAYKNQQTNKGLQVENAGNTHD